ncbi:MAG: N-6 DNA methylase [Oscillospiraceae bacterium]|nr:N-6 DNA methylase [Oscillospiraceae bacterium]
MTDKELKTLKDNLWHAADVLRSGAHLAANKYGQPILGLIFLRYADILFKQHKDEIDAEYTKRLDTRMEKTRKEIAIEKCGFFLPECAYYDFINDAPDTAEKADLVKKAMEAIERENPKMDGVLPKEVYAQLVPEEEPELLSNIVRIFKDIPENCTVDIFGEIYEYFLGNFALAEGKDGGTFYTPATVVRYMVEVLDPQPGDKKFLDPACGSGGMFVQAARYMHAHNANEAEQMKFRCYGVEKEPDTVKLAKMNLLLNNVRGDITEANSFYSDPYNAFGAFDYVMANPPFNVDEVSFDRVSGDARFNTYGVPRNATKSAKKTSDKKETVPNANYLWIGYFATALNEHGKAALVMANSASDAGKSEYAIRKKMIEEGIISQMVTLPSNMFSSVTLPATLWFFDKHKPQTDKKDEILFIDARSTFTQVDRAHRKFSDEQIRNLGVITRLYNGDTEAFKNLLREYKTKAMQRTSAMLDCISDLSSYEFCFIQSADEALSEPLISSCAPEVLHFDYDKLSELTVKTVSEFKSYILSQGEAIDNARIDLEYGLCANGQDKEIRAYCARSEEAKTCIGEIIYYLDNLIWLTERFPDGVYRDVIGLCKAAKLDGEDGIIDQDYSLNAGRYVGVVIEDDGMTEEEFKETMLGLNAEFEALNEEAKKLETQISLNLRGLFTNE